MPSDRDLTSDLDALPSTNEVEAIRANVGAGYYSGREGDLAIDLKALSFGDNPDAQEHLARCISVAEHAHRGAYGKHQLERSDATRPKRGDDRTHATSPAGLRKPGDEVIDETDADAQPHGAQGKAQRAAESAAHTAPGANKQPDEIHPTATHPTAPADPAKDGTQRTVAESEAEAADRAKSKKHAAKNG